MISLNKLTKGSSPSWSPDGKYLVFENKGIWIVDIETKKQTKIAQTGTNPNWSPDGNRIAYTYKGIWFWDKITGTHRQISKQGDHPCWYPDGKTLFFNYNGVWQTDINGKAKKKLINSGIPLSFSPDRTLLLLEVWQSDIISFSLRVLDLSTFESRGLAEGTKGSFEPEGQHFVYSKDGIWMYSFDKMDSTRIIMDGYDPEWSPKGDLIAFCSHEYIWLFDNPYRHYN